MDGISDKNIWQPEGMIAYTNIYIHALVSTSYVFHNLIRDSGIKQDKDMSANFSSSLWYSCFVDYFTRHNFRRRILNADVVK